MTTILVVLLGCYFKLVNIDKSLIKQTQMIEAEIKKINVTEEDMEPWNWNNKACNFIQIKEMKQQETSYDNDN
jgi:hypothetical protein